jgi:hypothetical protein
MNTALGYITTNYDPIWYHLFQTPSLISQTKLNLLHRSSNHSLWSNVSAIALCRSDNDLLLDLDERAACATVLSQAVRHATSLDTISLSDGTAVAH